MNRGRLLALVETAVMIGLSIALSTIKLFEMPQGGSVTAGSMVPILLIGLRHGTKWGVTAGVLAGVMNYMIEPYFVHPMQVLLDYPVAFGMLGLAGLASGMKESAGAWAGSLALFGRLVAHTISGAIFFAEYAGDQNPWIYSVTYNGSFMLPELAIGAVLLMVLLPALRKALPPTVSQQGAA